jgi:hypothetical protein
LPEAAHDPVVALAPLVVPVKLPPCGGTAIGLQPVGRGNGVVVTVGVAVATGSGVVVRVVVVVGIGVAEAVGVCVAVRVGVALGVGVRVVEGVTVAVRVGVTVAVRVGLGVAATTVAVRVGVASGVAVRVAVGAAPFGGVPDKLKVPFAPLKPSTTMKYVCPAVTASVARDAWWSLGSLVPQPATSSAHASCDPVAHAPPRT